MRRSLLPLLALLPTTALAAPGPSVYVCAHPDDCFLFMNPNLYDDASNAAQKTVIIYLTSGDAGLPFSTDDTAALYPYARERASIDATEWMADVGHDPITGVEEAGSVDIAGHQVARVSYANTVSYFLRLPDGAMYGEGFERYNYASLSKLKRGEISTMSIDGEATYANWPELVGVLSGILAEETEGASNVAVHIADPDIKNNYRDHSDHTTGASGMMEALTAAAGEGGERCYQVYKHIDYSITDKPMNLDGVALQNKAGSFAVLTATQRHMLTSHNWDEAHTGYLTRNYYTLETLPEGCNKAQ